MKKESKPFKNMVIYTEKDFEKFKKNPIPMKKETLEESCCTPIGQIKRYVDCVGCDRKSKQETIEEAIGNYVYSTYDNQPLWEIIENAVKFGAKWQQERSYSEEEVLKAQQAILSNIKDALQDENYIIDYLKQSKKK